MAHDHPSHANHHHGDEVPQNREHGDLPEIGPGVVRILFIDAVAGASGDMFLGALVDLGADFDELRRQLATLNVPGFALHTHPTTRHSIAGTKVDVVVHDEAQPHRHVGDLLAIIDASPLHADVKEMAALVLMKLAEAESEAHRVPIESVHLHEVGGLDCLVDVVGTCIALQQLGIDHIFSGPVSVGTGVITCAHGKMPEPAPGTIAILRDFPIRKTTIEGEMTTPTGAAIIAALAWPVTSAVVMTPRRVGYGAGTKDKKEIANLLRIIIADVEQRHLPAHGHAHEHTHDRAG